jgi:hypothetical protein
MVFDDKFLDSLPNEPIEAVRKMCLAFQNFDDAIPAISSRKAGKYDEYVEAFAGVEAVLEMFGLPFDPPQFVTDRESNINRIINFFSTIFKECDKKMVDSSLSRARERFQKRFGSAFAYEFSEGDQKRIQTLVNELRDLITASELFDAKHKARILQKLEGLQAELHKRMSSLDKLWGLIGEAGIALGKFGKDAKPFVDRIKEIAQITWRTQARAEELPSGTPLPLLTGEQDKCDNSESDN